MLCSKVYYCWNHTLCAFCSDSDSERYWTFAPCIMNSSVETTDNVDSSLQRSETNQIFIILSLVFLIFLVISYCIHWSQVVHVLFTKHMLEESEAQNRRTWMTIRFVSRSSTDSPRLWSKVIFFRDLERQGATFMDLGVDQRDEYGIQNPPHIKWTF